MPRCVEKHVFLHDTSKLQDNLLKVAGVGLGFWDVHEYEGQPKSPATSDVETETREHTSTKLLQAFREHPSTGHTNF